MKKIVDVWLKAHRKPNEGLTKSLLIARSPSEALNVWLNVPPEQSEGVGVCLKHKKMKVEGLTVWLWLHRILFRL
ncbi:hypothetical protein [Maribellus sediminis]|uniref:hypothetical protein n=1 Tax=Maribellus sediminis TaxID=2696285 RepID=UPI001431E2A1|nr:hypothetical protein [Maribellus sediminis]